MIRPGRDAPHPFVDFREILDGMSHRDRVAAVGASNYALLRSGVVAWDEVVTRYRVRTLNEVIALNKVGIEAALKAGVRPSVARAAYASVHTPEAEMVRQHREQLTAQIVAAGVPHRTLADQVASRMAGKATIVGASGVGTTASYPGREAELAAILADVRAADAAAARALPPGAVVTAREGEVAVRVGARVAIVRPGGEFMGVGYEQLRRMAR